MGELFVAEAKPFLASNLPVSKQLDTSPLVSIIEMAYRHENGALFFSGTLSDPKPIEVVTELLGTTLIFEPDSGSFLPLGAIAKRYNNALSSLTEKNAVPFYLHKAAVAIIPKEEYRTAIESQMASKLEVDPLRLAAEIKYQCFVETVDEESDLKVAENILGLFKRMSIACERILYNATSQYMHLICHSYEEGYTLLQGVCDKHGVQVRRVDELPVW